MMLARRRTFTSRHVSPIRIQKEGLHMKKFLMTLVMLIGFTVGFAACGLAEKCPGQQHCGDGCMPNGASCCPNGNAYCDSGWSCGADNMCHGSGGGGGGSSCGCGATLCNSNGICCPRGWSGCGNVCYASYNDALHAGCTTVKTCCP